MVCVSKWPPLVLQVGFFGRGPLIAVYINRTQEEVAHTCRGTINLAGACIDTIDSTHFLVTNGTSQVK